MDEQIETQIQKAVDLINSSEIICFPTETVYGLGADAFRDDAIAKIYKTKGRPSDNPLIVHTDSLESISQIAEINEYAEKIAENFWPGPISLVLKLKKPSKISALVTAGLDTVCVRIPKNEIAIAIIKNSKKYIAAPSANLSNYVSPTEYLHVKEAFPNLFVIDGGKCVYGIESTILDLSNSVPTILRHGFITEDVIENILKTKIIIPEKIPQEINQNQNKIIAPGMKLKHYSPNAKLIRLRDFNFNEKSKKFVAINFGKSNISNAEFSLNLSAESDLVEAAANLYSMMRICDEICSKNDIEFIVIADIPNVGIGMAINDKIERAKYQNS
jgi:L-threonylcarbamoyladenylate synthase